MTRSPLTKSKVSAGAIRQRIRRVYESASAEQITFGREWYWRAQDFALGLAEESGYGIDATAAVIAALSPQCSWKINKRAARRFLLSGERESGLLIESFERAKRVLHAEDPVSALNPIGRAPKIESFARNILGDTEAVTVDSWALRIALPRDDAPKIFARVGVYDAIADQYRSVALDVVEKPCELQAIVWVAARGRAE